MQSRGPLDVRGLGGRERDHAVSLAVSLRQVLSLAVSRDDARTCYEPRRQDVRTGCEARRS